MTGHDSGTSAKTAKPTERLVSPQVVPGELPGAHKIIPLRAVVLSIFSLAVAIFGAFTSPNILDGYDSLSWLLILIPAFLFAYYRGWKATTRALAIGTLMILVLELVAEHVFSASVDWLFLFWIALVVLAVGLGLAVLSELLQRERSDALVLAYTDSLTGLPNRRLLGFMLEKEFAAASRGRPLSVVLFEIDGFAEYNENYGDAEGDAALKRIAATLDHQMRLMNIGGRYLGASFMAILSGEKVDGAWVFAERTREAIAGLQLASGEHLSVSVGVAAYELWMRESQELIDAAHNALAKANGKGGNCVVCETPNVDAELPDDFASLPADQRAALEDAWRRQAVEDAEVRYRKLFDGVPVGLYRATPDGEVIDANPALVRMFGYPDRQSMLAVNAADLYAYPEDRAEWQERLYKETLVRDFEVRLKRYDGSIIWGRDTARVVLGQDGIVRYFTGVLEDITQRKLAEEGLRAANEKLQALFEAAPVAVMSLDHQGHTLSWNHAAETIFGWSEEEALGRLPPFVTADKTDAYRRILDQVLNGETIIGVEGSLQKQDGTPIDVNVYAAPLFAADGAVSGIMSIFVDVTEHRELEARLSQSQRMESVGRLAGGIAHDFNNLLTVILGNTELVMSDMPEGSPERADLQDIRSAADHAAALTRQLLAFSRRQILQPKVLSLNTVVTEMLDMMGRIIGEDIELVTQLDSELASTKADPVELGQVIMNMGVNARDAMPEGGRLFIETANVALKEPAAAHVETIPAGEYVVLTVGDTGIGMNEDTLSRIFEPFFTTKEKGQGTGLGLATVYGIVKQSGGYVSVESTPGEGTTFKIYLAQLPGEVSPEANDRRPESIRGSETILLVEDEAALRAPMRRGLEKEGYSVKEAANASEALAICESAEEEIDLMVTDLVMPGIDGLELGRRVMKMRPGIKVLYTSGYTDAMVARDDVVEAGDFLQKPYTPSALGARIRQLLET
jgi:diguanylate cyclase (GGDEF)-like protein/PAS domain S-box-containing protein